jgi:hypothetical protein
MQSELPLTDRKPIRTNFDPQEFIDAYEQADSDERRGEIRLLLRRLDSGRFHEFLDEAHKVLSKSDLERRRSFKEQYSDHLLLWIKAFGTVEDLNTFPEIEV